jgi:uncharacterized protein DUF4288
MTHWFAVSLLYVSKHRPMPAAAPLHEESIVLIEAEDDSAALVAAEAFGRDQEVEYATMAGDETRWTFERILAIHEIGSDRPGSGTEIFSRFLTDAQAKSLAEKLDF